MKTRQTGLGWLLPRPIRHLIDARRRATWPAGRDRAALAARFVRGEGIEIGALNAPLKLPRAARVHYVDVMTTAQSRRDYPELKHTPLVDVEILDNGECLHCIADSSQDFVIANHFLEHCQDPLGTILSHLRVLRPGGILFLAVPDKRCTFDAPRPVTPLNHLIRDYEDGPAWSRRGHYEEYLRLVEHLEGEALERAVSEQLALPGGHTHYHVWTSKELLEMLCYLQTRTSFDVLATLSTDEFVCVLRKRQEAKA